MNHILTVVCGLASLSLLGCGSSGSSSAAPTATTTTPIKKMFLSTAVNSGDLLSIGAAANGILGADAICQGQAAAEGITTAKALITEGTLRVACTTPNCSGGSAEHTDWVLAANTQYTRVDGTVIGTTNSSGIFAFALSQSIGTGFQTTWTGFANDWTTDGTNHCNQWSSNNGGDNGTLGNTSVDHDGAINSGTANCDDNTNRLYCVEQ